MSGSFQPFDFDLEPTGREGCLAKDNRRAAFRAMIEHAVSGESLTAEVVARWHHQLFVGLSLVPDPCYLGGYRGSAHPWLQDYEVDVGSMPVTPAGRVAAECARFFSGLERRTGQLVSELSPAHDKDRDELRRVVELAAWVHGEWLRIHPFANGNGRTARLLANHVLARFRVLPVVRLRPRPAPPYTEIATASMRGDLAPAIEWMLELLEA